jgi:hypothetical protein
MKVVTVAASIRYSKSLEPGEHKTIELSAEASLDPGDDWSVAQQDLYGSLTTQLKALWGKNGVAEHAPEGSTMAVPPPQEERGPGEKDLEHLEHHPRHISVRNTRPNLRSLSGTDKPGTHTKRPTALGVGKGRGDYRGEVPLGLARPT